MSSTYTIRRAVAADLDIIMHQRMSMFRDMGNTNETMLAQVSTLSESYFKESLADGRYNAWLVEDDNGVIVAGGGVLIFDYHASPSNPAPFRPLIVNMYTEPEHRRKGLARRLMETMIAWCREQGYPTVFLHASNDGRPLYQSLGFIPTNEMRLNLK